MKLKLKRLLIMLVVLTMVLPTGLVYAATDGSAASNDEAAAETSLEGGGNAVDLDPSTLNVRRIGSELDLKIGETVSSGKSVVITEEELSEMSKSELKEKVRVSIFFKDQCVLDKYSVKQSMKANAKLFRKQLDEKQAKIEKKINLAIGKKLDVKWRFTYAFNAISAEATYADIAKILELKEVDRVERERRYSAVKDESSEAQPNTSITSEGMVGASQAWAQGYTGAGTRIAIIDTGADLDHQSFDADAFDYAIAQLEAAGEEVDLMTEEDIPEDGFLNGEGVYYNSKFPYIYNYVDGDLDVYHINDIQGEHGSHVSGIAAANRFVKQDGEFVDARENVYAVGMAPDAQILVMKVFGKGGGAYDSDYMAALLDALFMDCDAVNLSLGTADEGFTYTGSSTYQYVMNYISENEYFQHMVMSVSAGNSYAWPNYNTYMGALFGEDVNFNTVGDPGSYINSFTVASAENIGTTGTPLSFDLPGLGMDDFKVYYTDSESNGGVMTDIAGDEAYDYVYIDSLGNPEEYEAVNEQVSLKDKIVMVNRGSITFVEKGNNLIDYEPAGLLVVNNQPGTINMALDDFVGTFPMASMTLDDGMYVRYGSEGYGEAVIDEDTGESVEYYTGKVVVTSQVGVEINSTVEDTLISDFSSWGVSGSLTLKPEITAPGGNIYSVAGTNTTKTGGIAGGVDQYELMSGTSMAAPHIAGLSALLMQYLKDIDLESMNAELAENYTPRQIAQSRLMSTAAPMTPYAEDGYKGYLAVMQQGAGLANVSDAMNAGSVVMINDGGSFLTDTLAAQDGKVKAEFGDDPEKTGEYSYSFTIYNTKDVPEEFELSTDMFTQDIEDYAGLTFLSEYTADIDCSVSYSWNSDMDIEKHDVDLDGDTDADDAQAILDYISGENDGTELDLEAGEMDGDGKLTSKDAQILLTWKPEGFASNYVVPANGKAEVGVSIKINEDLSAYENGAYIEGFTYADCITETEEGEDISHSHSIPLFGFYGNWSDASMFDKLSYYDVLELINLYDYSYDDVMDIIGFYSYSGQPLTNYMTIKKDGNIDTYTGNPYYVEDEFPYDRLAISSDTEIRGFSYNLIRPAGTVGYALSAIDEDHEIVDVLDADITDYMDCGLCYDVTDDEPINDQVVYASVNKTVGSAGLEEGDLVRVGLYAIPEYNAMYVNDALYGYITDEYAGVIYDDEELGLAVQYGELGEGTSIAYDMTVDDTAPVIDKDSIRLEETDEGAVIKVDVTDNQNIAYVAILTVDGEVVFDEIAPQGPEASVELDATDAVEEAQGYVAIFAGDYAGNESAVAYRVNDEEAEDPTIPVEVIVDPENLSVAIGRSEELKYKVNPITAEDRTVTFESADESIAVVSETGVVTGVSEGTTTVKVISNAAPEVYGECIVNVVDINEPLSGILYDEEANEWFIDFTSGRLPDYTPVAEVEAPSSQFMMNYFGNLIGGTLDVSTADSEIYFVDPDEDYSMTKLGDNANFMLDMAYGMDEIGAGLAYTFSKYLVLGNLLPDEDGVTGMPYAFTSFDDTIGEDVWLAGLAYAGDNELKLDDELIEMFKEELGDLYEEYYPDDTYSAPTYFIQDEYGTIWYTEAYYGLADYDGETYVDVLFTDPELIAETGVEGYLYQSLYYNGEYIFFSHYNGNDLSVLFAISPEDGSVTYLGAFDPDIWPVSGLYEFDKMAGVSVTDRKELTDASAAKDLFAKNIQRNTEKLALTPEEAEKAMKRLAAAKTKAVLEDNEEETAEAPSTEAEEAAAAETKNTAIEEPKAEEPEEEAVEEPEEETAEPEETEAAEPETSEAAETEEAEEADYDGSLNSAVYREKAAPDEAKIKEAAEAYDMMNALGEPYEGDEASADPEPYVYEISEDKDSTNGLVTITYDADELVYLGAYSDLDYKSVHNDEEAGTVTFAYADVDAIPQKTVLCEVYFAPSCEDQELVRTTKELGDELDLSDESKETVEGIGHDWDEPAYTWADDNSSVTAETVCLNNPAHVVTETVETTSEVTVKATCTAKGTTTYTAKFESELFEEQTKAVKNVPKTAHKYGEYKLTRKATTSKSGILTKTCKVCGRKVTKLVSPVVAKATSISTTKAKITWKKVNGAQRYQVYFVRCAQDNKLKKIATTKNLSYTKTKLKKCGHYKFKIIAQRKINGKWKNISSSYIGHFISGNYSEGKRFANTKSLKVDKTAVTVKAGKTKTINTTIKLYGTKKEIFGRTHAGFVRYLSTNTDVATVDKNGKIKGVAKGTCKVYAVGVNGVWKAVKVTVK